MYNVFISFVHQMFDGMSKRVMDEVSSEKSRVFSEKVILSSARDSFNHEMVENLRGSDNRAAMEMEIVSEKKGVVSKNVGFSSAHGAINQEMVENLRGLDNRVSSEMEIVNEKEGVVGENVDLSSAYGAVNEEMVENLRGSDNRAEVEMKIVIKPVEEGSDNRDLIHPDMVSKVLEDEVKGVEEGTHSSCVIYVKASESLDLEWVCRICHLTSEQSLETTSTTTGNERELIQLGCGCKDELGVAHSYCAEAWFKLKGNRLCEICGETAKNVTGVVDNRFMEGSNIRMLSSYGIESSERRGGCWRGQPFCNFLMACLVIAFVLPWFFRVNMF